MSRRNGGRFVTERPWIRTSPADGGKKPAISPSVVVLPHPDGPSSVRNSPSGTSSVMPATARISPYRFSRPMRLRAGSATPAFRIEEIAKASHALQREHDDERHRDRQHGYRRQG